MYVYALGDPRNKQIRYIGIAKDVYRRFAEHLTAHGENTKKDAWIAEIKEAGIAPTLAILESNVSKDFIHERERYWCALT